MRTGRNPDSGVLISRRKRSTCGAGTFDERLRAYALSAAAAGVGIAALASPAGIDAASASSTIVYTPANLFIGDEGVAKIDLNHDGIDDIHFEVAHYSNGYYAGFRMYARPAIGNEAVRAPRAPGAFVGSQIRSFRGNLFALAEIGASCKYYCPPYPWNGAGLWADVNGAYMGVRFQVDGETHYGWVRMNVHSGPRDEINITITGYAYNTVANQGLLTGVPGTSGPKAAAHPASLGALSLGALSLGSVGLDLWRTGGTK
ncbi:MAG: hypothetical protein WBX38_15360 [Candidatus Sulfotelmatobacter sp.]